MPSSSTPSLETAAANLVRKLGGTWRPGGAMCRCPAHDDDRPSLSVRIGDKSLLFKCFAGCTGIEVVRAIRLMRHDIPSAPGPTATTSMPSTTADQALAIWDSAYPLCGSPGELYLARRGIFIGSNALRFHPRTPLGRWRTAQFRPAIIAAVRDRSRLVAIQRIFIDGPSLAHDLTNPKLTLGRPLTGAVMLRPPHTILGLAEGVETALSASVLLGIPVWATLGNERLARVVIPDRIDQLILLPDADRAGRLAARRARDAYAIPGRVIKTLPPWRGHNDWNDVLQEEGEKERVPVRFAA